MTDPERFAQRLAELMQTDQATRDTSNQLINELIDHLAAAWDRPKAEVFFDLWGNGWLRVYPRWSKVADWLHKYGGWTREEK